MESAVVSEYVLGPAMFEPKLSNPVTLPPLKILVLPYRSLAVLYLNAYH